MDFVAPFAVAILGFVPLVLEARGHSVRNQICEFAMSSGSFKGELLSITWATHWYSSDHLDHVRFFIKTAGLYTDVLIGNIGADGINMERGDLDEQAIKSFYITMGVPDTEEITSVYEMRLDDIGYVGWLLLVNTKESQYMFDLYPEKSAKEKPKLLWMEAAKDEYAIVHNQEIDTENWYWHHIWGYVIRKDNVDGRDGIIMHQLWLEKDRNWRIGVEGNPKFRHFYYLVWDSTTALRLVHRSNGDKISSVFESSKLRKIPRGFISGNDMHLFDDELGCVAIVDVGHHIDLYEKFKEKQDLFFTIRYNVPFEKYFWCPDKFKANLNKSLDPNRCGKVGRSIDSAGPKGELKISGIGLLGIVGNILVALLAIAVLVLLAREFFAKGSSKDMDSSNGSSKTGGKSSSKKSRSGKSSTGSKKSRPGKSSTGSKKSRPGKSSTGSKKSRPGKSSTCSKSSKTSLGAKKSGAK